MVATLGENCRYALRDRQFTIDDLAGSKQTTLVNSVTELREILANRFNIRVPDHADLDHVLQHLIQAS